MIYAAPMPHLGVLEAWRAAARIALSHRILPEQVDWSGESGLLASEPLPITPAPYEMSVPRHFLSVANSVVWHSEPQRFSMLYEALWRLDNRDGNPLSPADGLGRNIDLLAKSVRRDIHKMHAFVRFREMPSDHQRRSFAAWFEPDHFTLEPGSAFFAKRFGDMDWMIATPHLTARFETGALTFGEGGQRPHLPDDASEELWGTYFANIFNPARIKLEAMRGEMPKKYWHNMPETRLIPSMLADAEARVQRMREAGASEPRPGAAAISTRYRASMPQAPDIPHNLEEARLGAQQCQRCGLCEAATQTVWGEGAGNARIMIVGEQPGDHEDLEGRPFVGPAGQMLRDLMAQADIDASKVWLTNAVKHFKFTPRGKRRLHQNPNRSEISHCRWWLGLELEFIRPDVTVALGASAAFALTGNDGALSARRGTIETGLHNGPVLMSWHPSYILRLQDRAAQQKAKQELTADLRAAIALCLADQS